MTGAGAINRPDQTTTRLQKRAMRLQEEDTKKGGFYNSQKYLNCDGQSMLDLVRRVVVHVGFNAVTGAINRSDRMMTGREKLVIRLQEMGIKKICFCNLQKRSKYDFQYNETDSQKREMRYQIIADSRKDTAAR